MTHQWLNVIHLIAGMVWLGGLLLMAVVVVACSLGTNSGDNALIGYVRRWSRSVTSPAMLILWACGIAMIVSHGGGIPLWLIIKILVLIFLSGLHGMLSASLRRLAGGETARSNPMVRHAPYIILVAAALVVILAKMGHFLG